MEKIIGAINTRAHAWALASTLALLVCTLPAVLVADENGPYYRTYLIMYEKAPEHPVERKPVPEIEPVLMPSIEDEDRHEQFQAIIIKASKLYGVDPNLIRAVIQVESAFDPDAVSTRGASGLMQLMPSTALELGVPDIFDPEHNVLGGVKYLKQLLCLFDDNKELALAAYNAGIGRVKQYDGVPPYKTTREYIRKVIHLKREYGNGGEEARKRII